MIAGSGACAAAAAPHIGGGGLPPQVGPGRAGAASVLALRGTASAVTPGPITPDREAVVLAYISAALCAIAVVLDVADLRVGPLTPGVFVAAALLCLSLHVAGVGVREREPVRGRR